MKRITLAGVIAISLALSSAAADPAAPTTVDSVDVVVADGTLTASGQATFGGDAEVIFATDDTNDFADDPDLGAVAGPLGIDVTELAIHSPGGSAGGVEFIIRVTDLQAPPPQEIIRYLWDFRVDGEVFRIQAKSSDVGSTMVVDDPVGAVEHINGAFRLRGNCAVLVAVSNCEHVMWIDGVFDVENDEIRMTVPLNDPLAPAFRPGAVITPEEGAGDMTASIQVGVSNNATSDNVDAFGSYTIPRGTISYGLEPAGTDPGDVTFGIETGPSFLGDGGDFGTEVDVSSLAPGAYELFVRACFTTNCAIGSAPFSV